MKNDKKTSLEDKWASEQEASGDTEGSDESASSGPSELERLRAEIAQLRDQLQRRQAELINFRRRTERERLERVASERAAVLVELLPVVDDFERALATDDEGGEAYREGVELILRAFQDSLRRLGLVRLEPVGEAFDPNVHEAVERQETNEVEPGHVVAVYKPGYRLGERLVRPAMVAVAAAPAEEADDGTSGNES